MKFNVISSWYGFSNHIVWSIEESKWVNMRDEAVRFELVPTCRTEIHFDNGKIFCAEERRIEDDRNIYIKSTVLYVSNYEKYGDSEEVIRMGSVINFTKDNEYGIEDFFELSFYHPLVGKDFENLKDSVVNNNPPKEIHIRFERNGKKTFSYDSEDQIVRWNTSIEGESLEPGSVWFQWNQKF